MKVNPISNTNFEAKNTFLLRAKKADNILSQNYWESLHYEAKARLNYQKFRKNERAFETVENASVLTMFAMLTKMAYRKLQSVFYDTKAHEVFPNRFAEPDNCNDTSGEDRFYKIKANYKNLIIGK